MHRIDGPGATSGGLFTEGSPAGGVPATVVTDDWMNDVQENLIALLTAAGITPTKGRAADVMDSIRTLTGSIVGSVRKLSANCATASASLQFIADEVILESALGGQSYKIAAFNKILNLASVGLNGMDAGTAPASGWVAVYAIYNPTTKVYGLLASNATSAKQSEVYSGSNMPAGFTASCLLSVVPTNASSQFDLMTVRDREVHVLSTYIYTTQSIVTRLAITAMNVPLNAVMVSGTIEASCTAASRVGTLVSDGDVGLAGLKSVIADVTAGGNAVAPYQDVAVGPSKTIALTTSINGSGTATYRVAVSGYKI